ncbi:MAG: phosphatidate cytidylyltransferase [Bacteroidetes bacterium]|nr:phosphatidate cytidylyltransferase [Bacteroidota bacterium]
MDTKLNNLVTRTIYGLLFAVIVVGSMLFSNVLFAVVMLFVVFEGSREMVRLHNSVRFNPNHRTAFYLNALAAYFLAVVVSAGLIHTKWLILSLLSLLFPYIHALFSKRQNTTAILIVHWQILIFIALPASLMVFLQQGHIPAASSGAYTLLSIILLIWINDIFAYLTGISFGKHKLFSRISPKKTWEGTIGGLLASLAAAWAIGRYIGWIAQADAIPLALIIVVSGSLGDLTESMLKRQSGIKDSGRLIPGHGGILDRFDASFFAVPAAFVYLFLTT